MELLYWSALVLLTTTCVDASTFDNLPYINYRVPKAIKVNGTYYVVARSGDTSEGILPIHTSTDLMEWKSAGFVFDGSNAPTWADNTTLDSPDIHQVGSNFLVYFLALNTNSSYQNIGVAIAAHPLGPYSSIDQPIVSQPETHSYDPSIIHDEDKLYLMWSDDNLEIMARQLNSDGLNFSSEETTSLLKPSLDWENGLVFAPWYLQRGNYHYLIYNGHCVFGGVGVARSSHALGPYEKLANLIIKPDTVIGCTESASVVKDLDGESDLIIFSSFQVNDPNGVKSVVLASVSWSANDWPDVGDLQRFIF